MYKITISPTDKIQNQW